MITKEHAESLVSGEIQFTTLDLNIEECPRFSGEYCIDYEVFNYSVEPGGEGQWVKACIPLPIRIETCVEWEDKIN